MPETYCAVSAVMVVVVSVIDRHSYYDGVHLNWWWCWWSRMVSHVAPLRADRVT